MVLLGVSLMRCYMVPEFRETFYKVTHRILKFYRPVFFLNLPSASPPRTAQVVQGAPAVGVDGKEKL